VVKKFENNKNMKIYKDCTCLLFFPIFIIQFIFQFFRLIFSIFIFSKDYGGIPGRNLSKDGI